MVGYNAGMRKEAEPMAGIVVRDAIAADAPALSRLAEQLGYPTPADVITSRLRMVVPG